METKFIGLEGFNEIESLPTKKRRVCKRELTTAQKTVRFVKRATTFCAKSVVRMSKNTAAKLAQAIKNRKGSLKSVTIKSVNPSKKAKTPISAIDRAFNESRNGTTKSAREIVSGLSFKSEKQYAHIAPSAIRSQKLLKKKAVLAVVACFSAITLSCVTVASALDMKTGGNDNNSDSVKASAVVATSDEAVPRTEIDSESASANLKAISPSCASLYIDGEFIGATEEIDQLNADLDQVLVDYRKDYDDETTTEFANSVEVVTGNASGTDLITADEIMALADGKFSISLSTDIVYRRDVAYDTKVKYDEDKSTSYKKVTTKGVKGEEEVTVRTTYVDGVQTDAVQTDAKTLKEAVDEVVVKGKAEDTSSSTSSSSTSSDSSSSSSSSSNSSSSYTTSSSGMFAWPLPYTHTLTSSFGTRWGRLHGGLDISDSGVYGQPIYASASGTVTFSGGDNSGYGNYVIIDHGSGYTTLYGHCSSLVAVTGQYVNQGDLIGYVGSTGNSTGPHLHFEIRLNGEKMDPLGYTS